MKAYDLLKSAAGEKIPTDISDAQTVGFQISSDGKRIWVCIDGLSIIRVKSVSPISITIIDDRKKK